MNEQIKLIAQRIRGLRDILGLSEEDVASQAGITTDELAKYENGEVDFNFSFLFTLSKIFKVDVVDILSGDVPKLSFYTVVKKGQGLSVERVKAYKYRHLAYTFRHRKAEPFMVTVEPKPENTPIHLNTHEGQELNYVVEGKLKIVISEKEIILEEGDSVYFDASHPHGMEAIDGKPAKFLAVVI